MSSPSFTNRMQKIALALLPVVLALLALTLIMPRSVAAAQIETSAMTLVYPGAAPCDTTLQACIASASPGDVITILPGTYHETFDLNKRVSLSGAGPDQTILMPGWRARLIH